MFFINLFSFSGFAGLFCTRDNISRGKSIIRNFTSCEIKEKPFQQSFFLGYNSYNPQPYRNQNILYSIWPLVI
jgi:hypothetical protein